MKSSWEKFRFVRIYDSKFKQDLGWFLKITDSMSLFSYRDRIMGQDAQNAIDIMGALQTPPVNSHPPFPSGSNKNSLYSMFKLKAGLGDSISIQDINNKFNGFFKAKLKVLENEGCIYINKNRGFTILCSCMKEVEERISNELIFPEDVIKLSISNWQGGSHYYISNNEASLKIENNIKWDSYLDALTAVDKYMEKEHPGAKFIIERKISQCV